MQELDFQKRLRFTRGKWSLKIFFVRPDKHHQEIVFELYEKYIAGKIDSKPEQIANNCTFFVFVSCFDSDKKSKLSFCGSVVLI